MVHPIYWPIASLLLLGTFGCTPRIESSPSRISELRSISLVRLYFEAINTQNAKILGEILADNAVVVMDEWSFSGKTNLIKMALGSISSRHCVVQEIRFDHSRSILVAKVYFPSRADSNNAWTRVLEFTISNGQISRIYYP